MARSGRLAMLCSVAFRFDWFGLVPLWQVSSVRLCLVKLSYVVAG